MITKYKEGDKVIMIGCGPKTLGWSDSSKTRRENKKRWFKDRTILTVLRYAADNEGCYVAEFGDNSHKVAYEDIKYYRKATIII
mgnify:CR=1 FL=1